MTVFLLTWILNIPYFNLNVKCVPYYFNPPMKTDGKYLGLPHDVFKSENDSLIPVCCSSVTISVHTCHSHSGSPLASQAWLV